MRRWPEGQVPTIQVPFWSFIASQEPLTAPRHSACLWEEGRRLHPVKPSWQEDKGHTKFCWRNPHVKFGPATLRHLSSLRETSGREIRVKPRACKLTKYPQQHRTHQAYLGNGLMVSSTGGAHWVDPSLWVGGFTGDNCSGFTGPWVKPSASVGGIKGSKPNLTFRATYF